MNVIETARRLEELEAVDANWGGDGDPLVSEEIKMLRNELRKMTDSQVLSPLSIEELNRSKYLWLIRKGYQVKEIEKALVKGSSGYSATSVRREFFFWRQQHGFTRTKKKVGKTCR